MPKLIVPGRVDLHQTEIKRTIAVVIDGMRLKSAFIFGDCPQQLWRYAILCSSFFKTKRKQQGRKQKNRYCYQYNNNFQRYLLINIISTNNTTADNVTTYSTCDPTWNSLHPIRCLGFKDGTFPQK